ncbi:MAG: MetS family NSS transporter small subunit [Firmicutes bacterium]|jgi:hypothetical protein|nr:MetS family NSS transporter small subunit [Melghirimyces thermohalophilus]MDA8353081.1 MetS family NSS transporter small subunit [Bacillota bacterium]
MHPQAIAMLLIGAVGLWGGLAYFLFHAYRSSRKKKVSS